MESLVGQHLCTKMHKVKKSGDSSKSTTIHQAFLNDKGFVAHYDSVRLDGFYRDFIFMISNVFFKEITENII